MQLVVIYMWRSKAYLPVHAQISSGAFMGIDPVYIVELNIRDLSTGIESVLSAGHPQLPEPTREEMKQRKDPVLAATKARSWKKLAARGTSYTIAWDKNGIRIDMSRLDRKGRWEYDLQKTRTLPINTSLETIVKIVLEDVESRPELNETRA